LNLLERHVSGSCYAYFGNAWPDASCSFAVGLRLEQARGREKWDGFGFHLQVDGERGSDIP